EGTAEIQRMVISRMQAREYAERLGYAAEIGEETIKKEPVAACPRAYPGGMHGPGHSHSHALDARRADSRRRMWWALWINVGLLLAEAIGGIITGSLAVLADAGHLLSDAGSIVLALIAARLAALPAAGRRTFGYQRS